MPFEKGQLPKAYLRLDPNIDQTHPDNLDEFIRLLCVANRQPHRGSFRSRAVLEAAMGRPAVRRFYARGDVADQDSGRVTVEGWEMWQEGDMTVADRVRRFRDKHRYDGVTSPVTKPLPTSEAARQQDSKASDVTNGYTEALGVVGEPVAAVNPWDRR